MKYYADSKGTRICYQIRGEGEPLILLMGFGADGNTWEKHAREYEKYFKCILIDNRGVGSSDQPKGPYSTDMMADDTVAVMSHAGVERARVAGISMGGAIAQELALRHPEKVRTLALISTWAKFDNYAKTVYGNLKKLRRTSNAADFMELLQLWIFAPPFYAHHMDELVEAQRAAADGQRQSQDGFEGQLDACIHHDTTARLSKIKVPTLVTVGEMDIFTPPAFSDVLATGITGAEYAKFPRAGHVHHWEDLERFNMMTTQFLKNH
ncbi:MAG: alpha/beta fold hydrolase [Cyclobacteriaceae bacterium]